MARALDSTDRLVLKVERQWGEFARVHGYVGRVEWSGRHEDKEHFEVRFQMVRVRAGERNEVVFSSIDSIPAGKIQATLPNALRDAKDGFYSHSGELLRRE